MLLNRGVTAVVVTIEAGTAESEAFDMSLHAGGIVLLPAAWTAASIGFLAGDSASGAFFPLYDADGALLQIDGPAAATACASPAGVFGAAWAKLWSQNGSGVDVNQTAERIIKILLKS